MLIDWLLDQLLKVVNTIWGWLPPWTIPDPIYGDIHAFCAFLGRVNMFVPVAELFDITVIIVLCVGALLFFKIGIKVLDWIADIIP